MNSRFETPCWQTLEGYMPLGLACGDEIGEAIRMTKWTRQAINVASEVAMWQRITNDEIASILGALPSEL